MNFCLTIRISVPHSRIVLLAFLRGTMREMCREPIVSFASSLDVAVHAAQRMDGDGDPNGWFQVIRGPRPLSVRWPSARSLVSGTVKPNSTPPRGRWRQGAPGSTPRRCGRVARSVFADGIDETSSEVISLKESRRRRSGMPKSPVRRFN